jgi:hypothetical protein
MNSDVAFAVVMLAGVAIVVAEVVVMFMVGAL